MRVAHTESSINLGGQELRILEQIQWARNHGHEFWLLAREESAVYREAARRNLPCQVVPFRGSLNPIAVLSLIRFAKRRRIDVIDCHSSRDASTAMAARLLSIPVVRTQHVCVALRDDLPHRLTWRRGSDRIIAASDSIADRIVNQGLGKRSRIRVVGDGIDLGQFHPGVDGQAVRDEFGLPPSARPVTLIGMIRPDKGQQYLVRAVDDIVARIPDTWFFIVGSATRPEFLARLDAEIRGVRHRDRIVLTGFREDVERFIAASDVIVLTSEIEARSRVIPQAFAMKKPVVAGRVGGIPGLVEDGRTGFLYPCGDVRKLAETVVGVLEDFPRAQVENAYALAVRDLSFDTMMAETLEVYREVAGGQVKIRSVPVCMFHHVNENAGDFLTVSVPVFAEMMERLRREGYATLSSEEFREYMLGVRDVPAKSVLLTFDDAWLDVFVHAYPILRTFGLKFTVFVVSGWADLASMHPRQAPPKAFPPHREAENLAHTKRAGEVVCNWDDLKEMTDGGLCSVENHTESHGRLPDIRSDIAAGREALRRHLGRPGNQLCWPSGRHDRHSLAIARALGIDVTYLVRRGVNLAGWGAMRVKRFTVDHRDGDWLMRQIEIFSRPVYGYLYSRIKPDRLMREWFGKR